MYVSIHRHLILDHSCSRRISRGLRVRQHQPPDCALPLRLAAAGADGSVAQGILSGTRGRAPDRGSAAGVLLANILRRGARPVAGICLLDRLVRGPRPAMPKAARTPLGLAAHSIPLDRSRILPQRALLPALFL